MRGTSLQGTSKGEKTAGEGSARYGSPRQGVVVVDAMPLYRSGAVAALSAAGVPVVGEASRVIEGVAIALDKRAAALLVGGAEVGQVAEAVAALPNCAVVALVSQPSRAALVEMLETGVAGLGPRSLTAEELVSTVQAAAESAGIELGESQGAGPKAVAPVFVPVLVADAGADGARLGSNHGVGPRQKGTSDDVRPSAPDLVLTPKELEILSLLQQGASNKKIADALYVTEATVKTHLAHIYVKLSVRGRHEAIARAFALHLLS